MAKLMFTVLIIVNVLKPRVLMEVSGQGNALVTQVNQF